MHPVSSKLSSLSSMYSTHKTTQQSSSLEPSANPDNLLLSATSQSLQIGPKPILRRPGRVYQKKNVRFTLPDKMELISHNPSATGPYKLQPKKSSRPAVILPNGQVQRSDHRATGKGTLLLGALYDDSDDDDSDDYNSGLLLSGEGGPMDQIKEEEMGKKEKEEEELDEVTKQIVAMNEAKQRKQKQQAEQIRLEELRAAQPIPKQRAAAPFWASPNQSNSSRGSSSRSSLFSIGGGRR